MSAKIDLFTLVDDPNRTPEQILRTARNVDLHEIGHALGLEHSSHNYDIMAATVFPDGLEFPLSNRDKNTLISVYSAPDTKNVATSISKESAGALLVLDNKDNASK